MGNDLFKGNALEILLFIFAFIFNSNNNFFESKRGPLFQLTKGSDLYSLQLLRVPASPIKNYFKTITQMTPRRMHCEYE